MFSSTFMRGSAFVVFAAALALVGAPANAQMSSAMTQKIVTKAANDFVSKIQGESCSDFAATMSKSKGSGSSASPSPMSSRLKSNPAARTQFVNIVAGPLLNKMIDCNMTPGGM